MLAICARLGEGGVWEGEGVDRGDWGVVSVSVLVRERSMELWVERYGWVGGRCRVMGFEGFVEGWGWGCLGLFGVVWGFRGQKCNVFE